MGIRRRRNQSKFNRSVRYFILHLYDVYILIKSSLTLFHRSGLEVGAQRPSPGSIGKLKLSSEMRQRLEKVTANHSVRSTKTTEKPALPREDGKVKRLEDNRKSLLEQQLGNLILSLQTTEKILVNYQDQI